jgi:hypothetical protein
MNKIIAPLATVAGVAAIAVTASLVVGSGGSSANGKPKVLHLANGAEAPAAAAAKGGSSDYLLTGTLPTSTPDDAPVWRLDRTADEATVKALADALHAGQPVRSGSTWRAGTLLVRGLSWTWSPCGADSSVSSDGTTSCTAVAAPGTSSGSGSAPSSGSGSGGGIAIDPAPPADQPVAPPPLPEGKVRDAAKSVFDAVGLDVSKAKVDSGSYGGSAALDPTVNGLATSGVATRVDVDAKTAIMSASGILSDPDRGDTYPLISAQDAYHALPMLAHPDICQIAPDGTSCLEPARTEITGAHLGLSLQRLADGDDLLVPSWLFDVKGSTQPIAGVALTQQYLAHDNPEPAIGSVDPGTAVAPPSAVPPVEPLKPIALLSYASATAGLVVSFTDAGCGSGDPVADVKESGTEVVVYLHSEPSSTVKDCALRTEPATLTVPLQDPLGSRSVIDGSSGEKLPETR